MDPISFNIALGKIADKMLKLDWKKIVKDNNVSLDIDWREFKKLTPKEQKTYVTLAVFDRMRIKYNEL